VRARRVLACVLATVVASSCARARMSLVAKGLRSPVSFSEGFYQDKTIVLRERYEVVHHFRFERDHVGMGVMPTEVVDVGPELESIIAAHSGVGIVNLRVVGRDKGGWNLLTMLLTMCTAGLLAPAYVGATIEGDVVRLLPETPATTATVPVEPVAEPPPVSGPS